MAEEDGESTLTVSVAIVANFGIAVAKAIAGALSGSAAMLSESAHSLADTANEVLLLVAVKRSNRAADERHPFVGGPVAALHRNQQQHLVGGVREGVGRLGQHGGGTGQSACDRLGHSDAEVGDDRDRHRERALAVLLRHATSPTTPG